MFSESFVPIGKEHGKGITGRSAAEITSMFVDVLRSPRFRDFRMVTLWADNCSGQNNNWWLFGALVKEVSKVNVTLEVVTVKFFEPGHTFMSADSFHSQIEKEIKKKKKLQDFLDLVDVVDEKGEALVLKFDDFYQVKKQLSTAKFRFSEAFLEAVIRCERFQERIFSAKESRKECENPISTSRETEGYKYSKEAKHRGKTLCSPRSKSKKVLGRYADE